MQPHNPPPRCRRRERCRDAAARERRVRKRFRSAASRRRTSRPRTRSRLGRLSEGRHDAPMIRTSGAPKDQRLLARERQSKSCTFQEGRSREYTAKQSERCLEDLSIYKTKRHPEIKVTPGKVQSSRGHDTVVSSALAMQTSAPIDEASHRRNINRPHGKKTSDPERAAKQNQKKTKKAPTPS